MSEPASTLELRLRARALARLAAFAVVLIGLFVGGVLLGPHSASHLRHDLTQFGPWVLLVAILAYALATCAFLPGAVLAGASGLLFGTGIGTAVAIGSATLGASIAFLVARASAGRAYRILASRRVETWTRRVERRGFVAVLYARVVPAMPFALVSYACGITRIRLRHFAGATAIGCSPRAFAYAALGGSIGNYSSPQAIVAIGVLVAVTIAGIVVVWRSRPRGLRVILKPAVWRSWFTRPAPAGERRTGPDSSEA